MFYIWQNLMQNKKSSKTLHTATLNYSTSQTKWDKETMMHRRENNNHRELCLDDIAMQEGWKRHCEWPTDVEFDWDQKSLTDVCPAEGPPPSFHLNLVHKSTKCGNAASTDNFLWHKCASMTWTLATCLDATPLAPSRVHAVCILTNELCVKVVVQQGSCMSTSTIHHGTPLPRVLCMKFWKNSYAEDLVIISDLLEEQYENPTLWKSSIEGKWFRVNMWKTDVFICGPGLGMVQQFGKGPCACVSRVSAKFPSSVKVAQVRPIREAVASLALWSPIPLQGLNHVSDWPAQ